MTPEEHKRARFQGEAFAAAALAALAKNVPFELAESYAAGMADGIRAFVTAYVSDRAAYDLLQQAADRVSINRAKSGVES